MHKGAIFNSNKTDRVSEQSSECSNCPLFHFEMFFFGKDNIESLFIFDKIKENNFETNKINTTN